MPKYIERYKDTKRPIKFKDNVKIIDGIHKGKIGKVGGKDPSGLPVYNVWFEDGTFDCFMSDEFINADENVSDLQIIKEFDKGTDSGYVVVRYKDKKDDCLVETCLRSHQTKFGKYIKIDGKRYYIN